MSSLFYRPLPGGLGNSRLGPTGTVTPISGIEIPKNDTPLVFPTLELIDAAAAPNTLQNLFLP